MNPSKIFISYSNKDADFVARLRQAIVDQGIKEPWTDFRNIKGGLVKFATPKIELFINNGAR